MGMLCEILLKKDEGVYRAGQPVTGNVRYCLDKATDFKAITVSFVGKGKCQWIESNAGSDTSHSGNQEYFVLTKEILQLKDNEVITQNEGNYEYPFDFMLPQNIPSSFRNQMCIISYIVTVKFEMVSLEHETKKFGTEILVSGNINPPYPETQKVVIDKEFKLSLASNKHVNIQAEIEKTFLCPGEDIIVKFLVNNNSNISVSSIKTELFKHFTYVSDEDKKLVEAEPVKGTKRKTESLKDGISEISCVMPTLPSLYSIQHTRILIGEYKVKVTVKFPFPHTNVSVEIPVVFGERDDFNKAGEKKGIIPNLMARVSGQKKKD